MSCNNYLWHLHLLAEDDATNDILIGFKDSVQRTELLRQLQILPVAGGYADALDSIEEEMSNRAFSERRLLVLIDFDGRPQERLDRINNCLDNKPYRDRVFVIGITDEAEALKTFFGSRRPLNKIGEQLINTCRNASLGPILAHNQLAHNTDTFARLQTDVCSKLFI